MNPIDLLSQPGDVEFTDEEEALIMHHLAMAYAMDERAARSREVQRVADKVRRQVSQAGATGAVAPDPFAP